MTGDPIPFRPDSLVETRQANPMILGTAAYAAATVIQRTIGLLLLPFFTRVLTPSEYGQIAVITTIVAAFATIVGMGLESAMLRAFVQAGEDRQAKRTLVNTVGGFAFAVALAAASVVAILLPSSATFLGAPGDALRLAAIGAAASAAATVVPLALLRAQERFVDYLRLTGLQVLFITALTLLFVGVLDWGVTGWMLANAVGGLLLLGRGLAVLHHKWSFEVDLVPLQGALAFGLPMIPQALAHWGLALSDRAILGAFVSDAEIGAYYIAFQACVPITVLAIALSQATQTRYAEALASKVRRGEVARMATVHVVITGLLATAVAVIGPPLIRLLLPSAYAGAGDYLPWLALGSALFGFYLIPMNAISIMRGRTQRVWIITVLAAVLNVALNLALVPTIGAMAAAVNTAVGYAALLAGVTIYMRAVCDPPIPFERTRLAVGLTVIACAGLAALILAPSEPLTELLVQTATLLLGAIVVIRALFYRDAISLYHGFRNRISGVAR